MCQWDGHTSAQDWAKLAAMETIVPSATTTPQTIRMVFNSLRCSFVSRRGGWGGNGAASRYDTSRKLLACFFIGKPVFVQ